MNQPTYTKETEYFVYLNPNPAAEGRRTLKWNRPDCVVRAISNSTDYSWQEVAYWLFTKAMNNSTMPNDPSIKHGFPSWLQGCGADWVAVKTQKGQKRMTAKDFALSHPKGSYIVKVAHHTCACVDGKLCDTWNCGSKAITGYFDMSNFEL